MCAFTLTYCNHSLDMFDMCVCVFMRHRADCLSAKLLRVEEPLRRCWNLKRYSAGVSGGGSSKTRPRPMGTEEEFAHLVLCSRSFLCYP